jgi:hypothetical protein
MVRSSFAVAQLNGAALGGVSLEANMPNQRSSLRGWFGKSLASS